MSQCDQAGQSRQTSISEEATAFQHRLDSFITKRMRDLHIPGVAVALVDRGEVVWAKGYGLADEAAGTRVTPSTVFQAASISKSVTAWGVMRLVERGKLELDAPAERYLTRWHLPPSKFDNKGVTIRRLLSHTAGLSLHGYLGFDPGEQMPTIEQSLSGQSGGAGSVHVEMQPGTRFNYSGGGYTLLQLIVEEASREKFSDYMQREVLQPLGMEHSSFEWTPDLHSATATPYREAGSPLPNYLYAAKAAAGLYATACDLARFVAAGMPDRNGEPAGRSVLIPETVAQMMSPAPATNGGYGFGYQIQALPGGLHLVYHPGGNRGWGTFFGELQEKRRGIVLLSNSDTGGILATEVAFAFVAQAYSREILLIAAGLGLFLIILVGGMTSRLRSRRRGWRWKPATVAGWLKIGCAAVLLLFAGVWWFGWYSDIVSQTTTGLKGIVPAEEMPSTFRWLTLTITLFCAVGIAACFTTVTDSLPFRDNRVPATKRRVKIMM